MEKAIKVQKRVFFFIEVVTFPKRNVLQFGKCIFLFFPGGETCELIFKINNLSSLLFFLVIEAIIWTGR